MRVLQSGTNRLEHRNKTVRQINTCVLFHNMMLNFSSVFDVISFIFIFSEVYLLLNESEENFSLIKTLPVL